MILEAISLAFIAGDFIYHRWIEEHPEKPRARQEVQIPHADDGAPVPLIMGRVRVTNPLIVWYAKPTIGIGGEYEMNMFFVLGIPMDDGSGVNRVHGMWVGDLKLTTQVGQPDLSSLTGNGGFEAPIAMLRPVDDSGGTVGEGYIEFLNGNPSQVLVDASGVAQTEAGTHMMSTAAVGGGSLNFNNIPGYRGYMSAFCYFADAVPSQWQFNNGSPAPSPLSFEASSYRDGGGYPAAGIYAVVGQDSNPINVLWDLYKAKFGKLGYDVTNYIDKPSWQAAATTLYNEGHGYSRYIASAARADDHIQEILRQIDGVLRENPATGKIEIKLVRSDYDPATIPEITINNCDTLTNFAASGWTDIVNKIRLVYTNRARDYVDDSELAQNPANAVGQSGQVNEQTLQMPGVCVQSLASVLGWRELAARSRPLMKCRALVGREFLSVLQGDAVKVTWSNPDIAGIIFRVASVDRGTITDGKIALDLISDFTYENQGGTPRSPWWRDLDIDVLIV